MKKIIVCMTVIVAVACVAVVVVNRAADVLITPDGATRRSITELEIEKAKVESEGALKLTQEKTGAFRQLAKYLEDHDMKAVLIAPQCEESRHWNEYSSPLGKYLSDVVKDLVDDYSTSHDIDPCRIYALGESFGGSGVWRLVTDYTDFFAAAMPAVCSPKLKDLKKFVNLKKCAKTPLCLVSGEKDEVYGPSVMAPYVEELTFIISSFLARPTTSRVSAHFRKKVLTGSSATRECECQFIIHNS